MRRGKERRQRRARKGKGEEAPGSVGIPPGGVGVVVSDKCLRYLQYDHRLAFGMGRRVGDGSARSGSRQGTPDRFVPEVEVPGRAKPARADKPASSRKANYVVSPKLSG